MRLVGRLRNGRPRLVSLLSSRRPRPLLVIHSLLRGLVRVLGEALSSSLFGMVSGHGFGTRYGIKHHSVRYYFVCMVIELDVMCNQVVAFNPHLQPHAPGISSPTTCAFSVSISQYASLVRSW